jgi:hypothetical protein
MKNFANFFGLPLNRYGKTFLFLILMVIFLFVVGSLGCSAQDTTSTSKSSWKLNSIALTTGETPLSSGLNVDVLVSKGKNSFFISYNTVLGQIVYEMPITKWCSFQPSGGIYHNIPWAGPMITFKMFKGNLITNHWFGWSAGIPEEAKTSLKNTIFIFSFQEIKYTLKSTSFDYILMHYEKCSPMHMFCLAQKVQLDKSKAITGSFTYLLQKKEKVMTDRTLWSLGFVWSFNN